MDEAALQKALLKHGAVRYSRNIYVLDKVYIIFISTYIEVGVLEWKLATPGLAYVTIDPETFVKNIKSLNVKYEIATSIIPSSASFIITNKEELSANFCGFVISIIPEELKNECMTNKGLHISINDDSITVFRFQKEKSKQLLTVDLHNPDSLRNVSECVKEYIARSMVLFEFDNFCSKMQTES